MVNGLNGIVGQNVLLAVVMELDKDGDPVLTHFQIMGGKTVKELTLKLERVTERHVEVCFIPLFLFYFFLFLFLFFVGFFGGGGWGGVCCAPFSLILL